MSIQEWTDKGFGTHQEILNSLRSRHRKKVSYCSAASKPDMNMTFTEHAKLLLEGWFGSPVYSLIGRYRGELSLQRVNDNGNYEVGNCRYNYATENTIDAHSGKVVGQSTRDKMSNSMSGKYVGKANSNFRKPPWKNAMARKENSQEMWSMLDKYYEWWLIHGHKKSGGGCSSITTYFNTSHLGSHQQLIIYCRRFPNGSWYDSQDYTSWKEHFNVQ